MNKYLHRKRIGSLTVIIGVMWCGATSITEAADLQGDIQKPGRSADNGKINIGIAFPLTSQAAEEGKILLEAVELYMNDINHKMAGKNVQLVVENTQSSAATAVQKFKKLINQDKVPIIAGTYLSSELYGVAPVADSEGEPFVVVSAGADNITQRLHSRWIVRTGYTSSLMSHALGEYARKTLGYKRIVTIGSDYAYGYEVVGGFQQTFEGAGGKVVQKIWVPLGFKEFSQFIKSIRKDADAVYFGIAGQSRREVITEYAKMGPKLPMLGDHNVFDESLLPDVGPGAVGGISATTYSRTLNSPVNQRFVQEFQEKYGQNPGIYAANGYTAIMAVHKAIEALNGDMSDKVRLMAALRKVTLKDSPLGPISFDSYGQAICSVYIRKVTKSGDAYTNTVVKSFPHVSQFWSFAPTWYMAQPPYSRDYPPCNVPSPTPGPAKP